MAKPTLLINPVWQFVNNGLPLSGGTLTFYNPGTTTLCNTYTDSTLGTPNPNPITLNPQGMPANGVTPIQIWINQAVKLVVQDSLGNAISTQDNVPQLGQTIQTESKTTSYVTTAADRDYLVKSDASGGNIVMSLLSSATAGSGFRIQFKKIDSSANTVTITPNATDNIDGSNTSITLRNQNDYVALTNDGTQWFKENSTNRFGNVVVQKFTTSGTYTPTAGMINCIIECVGGGGGAGGTVQSTGQSTGGGGGGGSYARLVTTAATIGSSQTVTIGAGGAGGTAGNNTGSNGTATSVGALCIANGGSGGQGSTANNTSNSGGAGGTAGTGSLTIPGQTGALGLGGTISTVFIAGGTGGNSAMGWGGPGGAGGGGGSGVGYGAGGGGGSSFANSAAAAGTPGTTGVVLITEFINQS